MLPLALGDAVAASSGKGAMEDVNPRAHVTHQAQWMGTLLVACLLH